jgi:hypothetical protein
MYYRLAMKCVLTFFSCIQEALKSKFSKEVTIIEC